MIKYVNGTGTGLRRWKLKAITPLQSGDIFLAEGINEWTGPVWSPDSWKDGSWIPTFQLDNVSYVSNQITLAGTALERIEIEENHNIDNMYGVPCIIEVESRDDYAVLEIEIINGSDPNDPLEWEFEITFKQTEYREVWDLNDSNNYDLGYSASRYINSFDMKRVLKFQIHKKALIGLELYMSNINVSGTIRGLEQFEQLEALKVKWSDMSDSSVKIDGKLPKSLKHIWFNRVEVDDIDTGESGLISLYTNTTICEALTDILEKMPESMEFVQVDPVKGFLVGGQPEYLPWKFNLGGRLNLNPNLLFIGLYGSSLTLENAKALYELFKDIPERETTFPLFYSTDSGAVMDYSINVLEPMFVSKNIVISEL